MRGTHHDPDGARVRHALTDLSSTPRPGTRTNLKTVSSSDARNGFAKLIDGVARSSEPVLVTRKHQPAAVVMSVAAYRQLVDAAHDSMGPLRRRYATLVADMQTRTSQNACDALFAATCTQLGKAAVKGE